MRLMELMRALAPTSHRNPPKDLQDSGTYLIPNLYQTLTIFRQLLYCMIPTNDLAQLVFFITTLMCS